MKKKENKVKANLNGVSYAGIKSTKENLEFGGPLGVLFLILWSHYILFYFWYCYEKADGKMILPTSVESLVGHLTSFKSLLLENGIPSQLTWISYFSFFVVQLVLAAVMPGMTMYGLPTAPNGYRLPYHCNGYLCYYFCICIVFLAHYFNIFSVSHLVDNYGQYLVASMIIADVTSVLWYLYGIITSGPEVSSTERSGYIIYDFFMGTVLYPRLGEVDIKMVAECRWSWLTLMLLTISCAVKQYETLGYITKEMTLMIIAHWLYSNATVKGEHLIPCTWDMFHEKFGWMLNFWNITGVPFLYCFQSLYIFKNQINHQHSLNNYYVGVLYVLLLVGYYVFDTANSQKACFKLPGIKRNTFPQLPWGALEQPIKHISTPKGALLIDGWYSFARKLQYTGDIVMALTWGLVCGFGSSLPYFYAFFFICMISHRQWRDEIRCREKYGKYWEIYTKRVPNIFFPSSSFYVWLFTGKKPKDLD